MPPPPGFLGWRAGRSRDVEPAIEGERQRAARPALTAGSPPAGAGGQRAARPAPADCGAARGGGAERAEGRSAAFSRSGETVREESEPYQMRWCAWERGRQDTRRGRRSARR